MWKMELPYEEKNQIPFTGTKWKCENLVLLLMPLNIIPDFTLACNKCSVTLKRDVEVSL